jgi:hypothetical protein
MAIVLTKLIASGLGVPDCEIVFGSSGCLIRGPSDTGKSYIRDCLWYLLGGDKAPKLFPESEQYNTLSLEFQSNNEQYRIVRGKTGGASAVYKRALVEDVITEFEPVDVDEGELLVQLSGAKGLKILRSKSDKGSVTGGDLRHWFLLSQPTVISEDPTSGANYSSISQRVAAFNLFLTGSDDAAIELTKSTSEVERIVGQLTSAQDALARTQAGIPPDIKRLEVIDSMARVEESLSALTTQYEARALQLRIVRTELSDVVVTLNKATVERDHSSAMVERFELLEKKYLSDLQRLGATDEGIGLFQALPNTPCPLCHTPAEAQIDPKNLKPGAPQKYRVAITAEIQKIRSLRHGLLHSLERERERSNNLALKTQNLTTTLGALEHSESKQLNETRVEFSADPRVLAHRHSELSALLGSFDEIERLTLEIERLKKSKIQKRVPVSREGGTSGLEVAAYAKNLLNDWGFLDVTTVSLDALECDIIINGRKRLSFGAGKRALFLTALTIALMQHSMVKGYPHLGLVVIDSPLKAYADVNKTANPEIPAATVTENFYSWLSYWKGPGQIVVLENQEISNELATAIGAIQFSGVNGVGRTGFYPLTIHTPIVSSLPDEDDQEPLP